MSKIIKLNTLYSENYFDRGFQIVQFPTSDVIHIYGGNWTPFSPCFNGKKFDEIVYMDNGTDHDEFVYKTLINNGCEKCIDHLFERNKNMKRFSEKALKEAIKEGLVKE